jgi:hypothetical protein
MVRKRRGARHLGLQECFYRGKRELIVCPIDVCNYVAPLGSLPYRRKKRIKGRGRFLVGRREDRPWWLQVSFRGPSLLLSFSCSILIGRTREVFWNDLQIGLNNILQLDLLPNF